MRIEELNAMDAASASAVLAPCADVPRWVSALVAARPYDDRSTLLATADRLAGEWTSAEVELALADHPRIGERHPAPGASAAHSDGEQAGVDPDDAEVQRRLAEGNRAYEVRFDRIFLVRAAGRSAAEILDQLEKRLTNEPGVEVEVTAGQLREIAALRLRGTFEP